MDSVNRIALAFLAAVAFVSCNKISQETATSVEEEPGQQRVDILYTSLEQPGEGSKLELSGEIDGKYRLLWEEADDLAVVGRTSSGIKRAKFTIASGVGESSGTFSGTLPSGCDKLYAVFPYDASVNFTETEDGVCLSFPVPKQIGAQKDNMANHTLPAVAKVFPDGSVSRVALVNVFGLLRVTLSSDTPVNIKKIVLHDLGGNLLWGNCMIPVNAGGGLDCEKMYLTGGDNSISMLWSGYTTLNSTPKSFCFRVPPGALDRGFSLVLYENDSKKPDGIGKAYSFLQKVSNPVAAVRSAIVEINNTAVTDKSEPYEVRARGYYKSIFVNAGMYLSNYYTNTDIPSIKRLVPENDYEYFASHTASDLDADASVRTSDSLTQWGVFVSSPRGALTRKDANGALLYPDGEPRFRTIYTNGGKSSKHGPTLGAEGRERVHEFFMNGGSYAGSCAGSFLSSTRSSGTRRYGNSSPDKDWSFGLWPGDLRSSHLPRNNTDYPTVYTDMKILPEMKAIINNMDSASVRYPDLISATVIKDVRHHGGSYLPHNTYNNKYFEARDELDTLMSYQLSTTSGTYYYNQTNLNNKVAWLMYPDDNEVLHPTYRIDSISTWAYKKNTGVTGRVVCSGSHPEASEVESHIQYTRFMLQYSMDGNGDPTVKKGDLVFGETRGMTASTSDDTPEYAKIGDRQYHHFKFTTTEATEDFYLMLGSPSTSIDLYLSLRKDDFAWLSDADYTVCNKGSNKVLHIKNLPAGTWYVGVYCATTVTGKVNSTSSFPKYFVYSGTLSVLDGTPYYVTIGKEVFQRDEAGGSMTPQQYGDNDFDN